MPRPVREAPPPRLMSLTFAEKGSPASCLSVTLELDTDAEPLLQSVWPEIARAIFDFTQIELPLKPDLVDLRPASGADTDIAKKKVSALFFDSSLHQGRRKDILNNFGLGKQDAVAMLVSAINSNLRSTREVG